MANKRAKKSVNKIVKDKEFISDFLSGALYGQDWFRCGTHEDTDTEVYETAKLCNDCAEDVWADVLLNGGYLAVEDNEDGAIYKVGLEDLVKGFKIFMLNEPRHYADMMTDNGDLWTYNSYLQTILFGEVVYG